MTDEIAGVEFAELENDGLEIDGLENEVVLFSIVALKTLDISQGSVAIHLRCAGIFSGSIITHFLLLIDHLLKGTPNSTIDWIQVRAVWATFGQ